MESRNFVMKSRRSFLAGGRAGQGNERAFALQAAPEEKGARKGAAFKNRGGTGLVGSIGRGEAVPGPCTRREEAKKTAKCFSPGKKLIGKTVGRSPRSSNCT